LVDLFECMMMHGLTDPKNVARLFVMNLKMGVG
jgi:hypothetical protein